MQTFSENSTLNKEITDINEVRDLVKTEETANAAIEKEEINKNAEDIPLENNLELAGMSRKEKRAAKKARIAMFTKDMNKKEKISYFLYYNKWKFIAAFFVMLFIVSVINFIIRNNLPVALSYAVINNNSAAGPNEAVFEDYLKYYNFSDIYQIRANSDFYLSYDEYVNDKINENGAVSYQYFPIRCEENYYDIVFSDQEGINYCLETSLLLPLETALPAELITEINQKYPDCICGIKNDSGTLTGYYIDISDTDFAKKLNLTYEDIFICFPGTSSKNEANTIKIVKYIMNLDYEIN
ncbi:MAG: hypothetical protein IJ167_03325 [Lachnospiraceae bacterium]|nr:hypothetical protein [Lachnospiraceae bacterium]